LNDVSVRRGVLTGSVLQGMAITVPIGVPLFFIAAAATGYLGTLGEFSVPAMASLATAGILHFVWGRYCNYRAIRAIGINLATPLQQFNLLVTLAAAVGILGEALTPLRLLGIALVLLGPGFTLREARAAKEPVAEAETTATPERAEAYAGTARRQAAEFEPRYGEGYLFALLSATGYGLSPIFIRLGLEQQSLGGSFAGGLIAYVAASVVMAAVLIGPGQLRHALAVAPDAAKWFTISGVIVCISQMFVYMALAVAPVTVVAPINRLTLIFRLYFSRLLNPSHEVFSGRVIAGTVISLAGAVLLSLSTEVLASLVPLPEPVLSVLKWQWR
jgi:uncharacterized membrane protein